MGASCSTATCLLKASAQPRAVGEDPCVYNSSLPSGGGPTHSNGADSVVFPACRLTYVLMSLLFAVTTPLGVGIGLGIRTTYNENSSTALGVQGTFESVRHIKRSSNRNACCH